MSSRSLWQAVKCDTSSSRADTRANFRFSSFFFSFSICVIIFLSFFLSVLLLYALYLNCRTVARILVHHVLWNQRCPSFVGNETFLWKWFIENHSPCSLRHKQLYGIRASCPRCYLFNFVFFEEALVPVIAYLVHELTRPMIRKHQILYTKATFHICI